MPKQLDGLICTIEARMTSSRLPGKVLMEYDGRSMLELMVNRVRQVKEIRRIVVATTINESDQEIVDEARRLGVDYFRGSENDVLERVIGAAEKFSASTIVALTGDCPLIDPNLIQECIDTFAMKEPDYLSNALIRSYPDGMDVQVLRLSALKKSSAITNDRVEREHVTLHITRNPNIFTLHNVLAPLNLTWPDLGLTLDEIDDFQFISEILSNFSPRNDFSCAEIIEFLRENPSLIKINSRVVRKGDS
jgi:spore coat polysaccharide biosynthesis protein SpsF